MNTIELVLLEFGFEQQTRDNPLRDQITAFADTYGLTVELYDGGRRGFGLREGRHSSMDYCMPRPLWVTAHELRSAIELSRKWAALGGR